MKYFVEDTLYATKQPLLMRFSKDKFPERYEYNTEKWVIDKTLNRIHIGEIAVNDISEEEAKSIIKNAK